MTLSGKTLFITGGSRGIGLAIALRAARDGANIVIAAKTDQPHAVLSGTIHTAAKAVEEAGGKALSILMDIRSEEQIDAAIQSAVDRFGGIDILVNNATALFRGPTLETPARRFDLMYDVNVRGMYLTTQKCVPHLKRAANPHVLSIAPLLMLDRPERYAAAPAFMISKFSMSLMTMAFAQEFAAEGIAFNALWPRVSIWTDGNRIQHGEENRLKAHRPEIMGDAAWHILTQNSRTFSGRFTLADDVLRDAGVVDFSPYYYEGADPTDLFKVIQVSYGLFDVE